MVVAYELEFTALRKDCGFIVDRTIFETEKQARDDLIATDDLELIAHREHAALFRTQHEKAVDGSLHMAHGYSLRQYSRLKLCGTNQHGGE
jgi:hypothetical protein